MPELPDLLYIVPRLRSCLVGRRVASVLIRQPVVVRSYVDGPPEDVLRGRAFTDVSFRGPFIRAATDAGVELVVNLMLAGRLHLLNPRAPDPGHLCLAIDLDDGTRLALCDDEKMAKVYLVRSDQVMSIPRYGSQGIDVLSDEFTPDAFAALAARHRRKQVRVFIIDL
jgi:formamidopyrimidine-DNA glycosylase